MRNKYATGRRSIDQLIIFRIFQTPSSSDELINGQPHGDI